MKSSLVIVALLLSACTALEQDAYAEARPRARFELKGTSVRHVAIAPDGDVIAAGPITGTTVFGGNTLESKVKGIWIARLGPTGTLKWASLIDRGTSNAEQYASSISVAADGRIRVAVTQDEAPYLRRVTLSADGATQTVDALAAETKTLGASFVPVGDVLVSEQPGRRTRARA